MTRDIQHSEVVGEKRTRESGERGGEKGTLCAGGACADRHPGQNSSGRADYGDHRLRDGHHEREYCGEMSDFGNHAVSTYLSTSVLPAVFDNRFASSIDCAASIGM